RQVILRSVLVACTAIGVTVAAEVRKRLREAQMGRVTLTTDGPNLLAEVLDEDEGKVLASFPVPSPQPVALPAGTHQLRLSASGLLSETWPLHVERGGEHTQSVRLRPQWLWPPLEVKGGEVQEPIRLRVRDDLAVISWMERTIRLLDGATGKPLW